MTRHALIAAVLAALLVGGGVWFGYELRSSAPAAAPEADLLRAEPEVAPEPEAAPKLLGEPIEAQILTRLGRLEEAVASLQADQRKLAKDMQPAAELMDLIRSKMPTERVLSARLDANRTAAIATMRNVVSAQAQIQASGRVDTDRDGTGEYAGFREMSGAVPGRMGRVLIPPVLSSAFKRLTPNGEAERSGYLYRFYLPGPGGEGIGEPEEGFSPQSGIDADLSETTWCIYAWPLDAQAAGARVFFINQGGDVLTTEDARYSGYGGGPKPDAAFTSPGAITGAVAINKRGSDGNVWKVGG